ncbi:ATPase [Aureococcus anophagefferens]|nr:ATPase [Aureococcus anophagefferens]
MCKATELPEKKAILEDVEAPPAPASPKRAMHLLRYATWGDLGLFSLAMATVTISGANQPAQLIIFGNLIDSFNDDNTAKAVRLVHFFALMYALVGVQQLITITIQTALATRVAAKQARRCREHYFAALLRQPVAWFDGENQGAVGASVLESTLAIQDGLGEKFTTGLQGVLAFVFGVAVSLYYAWSLTLVTIGALPIIVALLGAAAAWQKKSNDRATAASAEASAAAMEALTNVRTVAAFGAEQLEADNYRAKCAEAARESLGSAVATGLNGALVAAILYSTWALGLWYGSYLIRSDMADRDECNYRVMEDGDVREPANDCVTGGDIMTAFLCVLFGGLALLQALPGIAAFTLATAEARKIFKIIDDAETCALVGPSGCGKSTAVSLLLRFYDVDGGALLVDGVDARTWDVAALRAKIGLVAQEPVLFSGTIADNIAHGRAGAGRADVERAAKLANAFDFVGAFPDGFETEVGDCGVQLSGGQKQRVAIARALVRDPEILVLDEATSALDAKSERVVQRAIDDVVTAQRRTTLVIAHRLSTVRRADKIAVFADGAVAEEGTHESLMDARGTYCALVEAQLHDPTGMDRSPSSEALAEHAAAEDVVVAVPVEAKEKNDDTKVAPEDAAKDDVSASSVVGWLWSVADGDRRWAGLGCLGAGIGGATQPLVGFLMAEFITAFFNTDRRDMRREAQFWALMFVAMGGGGAIGELFKSYGLTRVAERVVRDVRAASFESMIRQAVGWHDSPTTTAGALAARLAQDCSAVRALVGQRIALSVAMLVIVLGGLALSFDASWRLTLVTLAIIPMIVAPIAITATYVAKVAEAANESLTRAGGVAAEAVLHVRTVRAYGIEAAVTAKFDEFLALPEQQAIRKGVAGGLGAGVAAATILFGAAFQYYIGGLFFRKGWVEFGDLMTVLLVVIFMAFGIGAVAGDSVDKAEAMAAPSALRAGGANATLAAASGGLAVTFDAVEFAYPTRPDRPVYAGLSLTVNPGETVAFVGESGAGKSTAVQLLLRYYDCDGGRVLVDGLDVRSVGVKSLRASIGLVSQEPCLFTGTIADNIRYGKPAATDDEVERAAKLANAFDFVGTFPDGFRTAVGARGVQLSGGQKQRVAIARALVRDPRCLVLDEATSALDAKSERVVQDALDALLATTKCTTIVIAHRLSTIKHASKICVFGDGVLKEEGPHEALMDARGPYFGLVSHQLGGDAN